MKEINILLLSGAGSKCIAYIGVLKKLKELSDEKKIKLDIKEICSVSAGSIIGLLYILGYSIDELKDELLLKNLEQLKDIKYTNFFSYFGIDSCKNIISWIEYLIKKKIETSNITFKELYDKYKIHYKVLATNLHKYNYTIFDYINTPDYAVIKAIRLSISIPFYFHAIKYKNEYHVDGAIIDNYPIKLYKSKLINVLGIKSINYGELRNHKVDNKINSLDTFIYNIIYCIIVQKEKETSINEEYQKHTIYIYTNNKRAIDFSISLEDKLNMIDIGYSKCEEFFFDR